MTCATDACVSEKVHAKGLCKRCYLRAYNQTPERKARRLEYIAQNREAILKSYRKYNEKRRPQRTCQRALVRVSVKGWGCIA